MKRNWQLLIVSIFLVGFLLTGMIGTSTSMTFIWPAYALLGLTGCLSISLLFTNVSFSLPRWTTLATFALVSYLLVRASDSPVAYFAREDAALILAAFLSYCLFLSLFSSGESRKRLIYALAALVVLNLLFALIQVLFKPTFWLIPGYERTFSNEPGGLFNHPNHFSGFIGALVPLWLGMAIYGRNKRPMRLAWATLAGVSILFSLKTGSAVTHLTLGTGLLLHAIVSAFLAWPRISVSLQRSLVAALAFGALILTGIGYAASGPISRAIDRHLLTLEDGTSLPLIWQAGVKQLAESPLVGTGSRSSIIFGRLHRADTLSTSKTEPEFIHSEYLQALADYGIVGFGLFVIAVGMHGFIGIRFIRAYSRFPSNPHRLFPQSDHLAIVTGSLGTLAAFGVFAAFDFAMHLPAFAVVAAILFAILAAPDPMASALSSSTTTPSLPGGSLMFMNRAIVFGCGIAMLLFGIIFSRSEYHYEVARVLFEADPAGFKHHRHLQAARAFDSQNPKVFTLSAHAQVAGITSEMAAPARQQALEQADLYFNQAWKLYPQDVFAAVGHASVLDELGKRADALQRLEDARAKAPNYGVVMLAEAEHHLRYGKIVEAETAFVDALGARAFRDTIAAQEGMRTISEWKLIAAQNGIDWQKDLREKETDQQLADRESYRSMPAVQIRERNLAAEAVPKDEPENPGTTDSN